MKTIRDAVLSFKNQLNELYGPHEAEAIAMLVLQELTGFSRGKLKAFEDDELPSETADKLPQILYELETGKPVQYILGSTEFYGLHFLVNPATLIPRPETEELVQWILDSEKLMLDSKKSVRILDIGTGTGCIAISLKINIVGADVTAIDISPEALKTAERNATINEAKVKLQKVDILDKDTFKPIDKKYNVIVSNPPYVTPADKLRMHSNVTNFEPHTALFVPEDDPLIFYTAIAAFANAHLDKDGLLFFEINEAFGKETCDMLTAKGFINIELRQDMSGRDRMIKAIKA